MLITFELDDDIAEQYLDHWNEVHGKELNFDHPQVKEEMAKEFGAIAEGELEMRTDDLDGFETENDFPRLMKVK